MTIRSPKNHKFLPQPKGTKTSKMLDVEKRLGHTLEQDWQEFYHDKNWGLKKMADRWMIRRPTLSGFGSRQGWIGILGLKKKDSENLLKANNKKLSELKLCEICGEETYLEEAHFIPKEKGGPNCFMNIIKLCPNCHTKLDRGDIKIEEVARNILLERNIKSLKLKLPPWYW